MAGLSDLPIQALRDFSGRWAIQELAVFGSFLRDDFGSDSDIDFLATFAPGASWTLFDHVRMEEELGQILGRPADLVSRRAVEQSANYLRRAEILSSAKVIHAA